MIVLEHYHVVERKAVVLAAAYLHGPFFERADARGRFAGVEHLGVRALKQVDVFFGLGGNGAHTLHGVEHQALGLKDGLRAARNVKGDITVGHRGAVLYKNFNTKVWVYISEYLLRKGNAREYTGVLNQQLGAAGGGCGYAGEGRVVAGAYVFADGIGYNK